MNNDDLTLLSFLQSHELGEIKETPTDVLEMYGHTSISAMGAEKLFLTPNTDREYSFYIILVVEYLLGLDFERTEVIRIIPYRPKELSKEIPSPKREGRYTHMWKITAQDPTRGELAMTLGISKQSVMFDSWK